jgi:hypothetical protein
VVDALVIVPFTFWSSVRTFPLCAFATKVHMTPIATMETNLRIDISFWVLENSPGRTFFQLA